MGYGTAKFHRVYNPFDGLAESILTSNSIFIGEASRVDWSLVSSSATASRWTAQGANADGFQSALVASDWVDARGVTAPGLYSVDTIPRWIRFQRVASNSSSTILLGVNVGT